MVRDTSARPVRHNASRREDHTWKDNDFGTEAEHAPAARDWLLRAGASQEVRKRWGLEPSNLIYVVGKSRGVLCGEAIDLLAGQGTNAADVIGLLYEVGAKADARLRRSIQDALKRIKPANRLPVPAAGSTKCIEGRSTEIVLSVTDADDPSWCLSAEIVAEPRHGMLERKSSLVFIYTSKPGFAGKEAFTWRASDGQDVSEPVACTVQIDPDREGPRIASVTGSGKDRLVVVFDEPVTAASAGRSAAYRLQPAAAIKTAVLRASGRKVLLETAALTPGAAYTLRATAIADRSAAANAADLSHDFTFQPQVPGLSYRYYETNAFDGLIADPAAIQPAAAGVVPRFGREAATRGDNYALDFTGFVTVPKAGRYTFFTASDDGSHLWIDGRMVVDNGGMHPLQERSSEVDLEPGEHRIRVLFYQGSGNSSLSVRWQGPDIEKSDIPAEALGHWPEE
jgi:hypothetical protein